MCSYAQLCSTTPRALTKPDPRGLVWGSGETKSIFVFVFPTTTSTSSDVNPCQSSAAMAAEHDLSDLHDQANGLAAADRSPGTSPKRRRYSRSSLPTRVSSACERCRHHKSRVRTLVGKISFVATTYVVISRTF